MMGRTSVENSLVKHLLGYQAAGTGTDNSASLNMKGYDAATFFVDFGAITASADVDVHVEMSADDSTFVDAYDENGDQITKAVADSDDNKVLRLEVTNPNPDYPYLRIVVVIADQNAVINAIIGLAHSPRKMTVTQDSTCVDGGTWNGTFTS